MSSKMLDAYLGDITSRLDEGNWNEAQRLAIGLPHIAVALAAEDLTTSLQKYSTWCTEWIEPDQGNERYSEWATLSMTNGDDFVEARPVRLLQSLGLKRRLRASPPYAPRRDAPDAYSKSVVRDCQLLTSAFEAWRNKCAAEANRTVLMNLAKVGVLR
jgi:hypothetical protein